MTTDLLDALTAPVVPTKVAARLGLAGVELKLRRAWPRAADHLLLEYEASDGAIVPAQWHRDGRTTAQVTEGLPPRDSAVFALAGDRGHLTLQLRGADGQLPGLAPLVAQTESRLVVHQPGRRAVVRLAGPEGAMFAKVVPPKRAPALAATGLAASKLGGGQFDTPVLVAYEAPTGVLLWSGLGGVALSDMPDATALERGARGAGAALGALHRAPPATTQIHGPDEEIGVLRRWVGFASAFAPATAPRALKLLDAVVARLAALPALRCTIHRDFYDKQVFIGADGRVGLLDFDTLAAGDPALDLANALVHFELRALQGVLDTAEAARAGAALLEGYGPVPLPSERLGAYAAATRLRLACVYALRPRWRHCVAALLDVVHAPAYR